MKKRFKHRKPHYGNELHPTKGYRRNKASLNYARIIRGDFDNKNPAMKIMWPFIAAASGV